jgi:hypothetical protein
MQDVKMKYEWTLISIRTSRSPSNTRLSKIAKELQNETRKDKIVKTQTVWLLSTHKKRVPAWEIRSENTVFLRFVVVVAVAVVVVVVVLVLVVVVVVVVVVVAVAVAVAVVVVVVVVVIVVDVVVVVVVLLLLMSLSLLVLLFSLSIFCCGCYVP